MGWVHQQMVQANVLLMGQQPTMYCLPVAQRRPGQDGTNTRRKRPRRSHRRTLPVLEPCVPCIRTLPPIQRCLAITPNPSWPLWRVGQLLQHALQGCRRPCAMGVECRRSCLDRSLLGTSEAMGPRGRLRRSVGQSTTLHGRLGQEDVLLCSLLH